MKIFKVLILCTAFIFTACNSKSRTSGGPDAQIRKVDPNRACVPEDELLSGNIIGGQLVQQNDPDSKLVAMIFSGGMLCTGAAIGKNVILTAAHCISGTKETTAVAFYTSRSCESGFDKYEHSQQVERMFVNEEYDANAPADKMKGDIALIVLKNEIPEGYVIHKIADPDKINLEADLLLYGYGRISGKGDSRAGSGMLRKTSLAMLKVKILKSDRKVEIDQSSGSGICQGDSGGPSFVEVMGADGAERQILGINSYVSGPKENICSGNSYETLAFAYKDWIHSMLDPFGMSPIF